MQQRWLILISVACGTFMATLDSSIVNVALPSITMWFHTGLSHSRWVIISYLFSITGLLLFFGKLADTIGRKTVFNAGFVIFTIGSGLCGLAANINQLIAFRVIQGLGASMLMANGPAIITAAFPVNERGRALGVLAMVVSVGLAVGPSLGGLILRFLGWPSIFFVNVPFGILGTYLVAKYLPLDFNISLTEVTSPSLSRIEKAAREKNLPLGLKMQNFFNSLRYFDWLGAMMWMVIQVGYSLAIDRENVLGLAGPLQRFVSFSALALFFMFLIWEMSVRDPVLDISLFRSRIFRNGNVSAFLAVVGMASISLLTPFYLQNVRGFTPVTVGFIMTSIPITIFIVAPIAGRLSDIYGSRPLVVSGMGLLTISLLLLGSNWGDHLLHLGIEQSTAAIVFHLAVAGAGFGIFQSPNSKAIMTDVAQGQWGVASALLATVRNLGLVTGTAFSSMLLMTSYTHLALHTNFGSAQNFVLALQKTFFILGLICSIGIVTGLLLEKKK